MSRTLGLLTIIVALGSPPARADDKPGESVLLGEHAKSVRGLAFSPDGKTLASAGDDGVVLLWDVATRKQRAKFTDHDGWVRGIAFSPDGKTLATAGYDKVVRLWDVETGKVRTKLEGHTRVVSSVCISADGKSVAAGSYRTFRVWDATTGKEKYKIAAHEGHIDTIMFHAPDGLSLVTSDMVDRATRFWNLEKGIAWTGFEGQHPAFGPERKTIATTHGKMVTIWDLANGKSRLAFNATDDAVNAMAFSPNGKFLATADRDKMVRVWQSDTGGEVATLKGHAGWVWAVAFNPKDPTMIASAGDDKTVWLWTLTPKK